MKLWTVTLLVVLFAGCTSQHKLTPSKNFANGGQVSTLYFINDGFGGEVYQVRKGKDELIGRTGITKGSIKHSYLVVRVTAGDYTFRSGKQSDECNITIKKGEVVALIQKQVWDTMSVVGMLGIPAIVGVSQKQKIVRSTNEEAEKILNSSMTDWGKVRVDIGRVLEP